METHSEILIFKTNIESEYDLEKIAPFLNAERKIKRWNVDREDTDHVLRIESEQLDLIKVIQSVEHAGFLCEELAD
jgi:hypothetical protein